jgi:hypothetical protein
MTMIWLTSFFRWNRDYSFLQSHLRLIMNNMSWCLFYNSSINNHTKNKHFSQHVQEQKKIFLVYSNLTLKSSRWFRVNHQQQQQQCIWNYREPLKSGIDDPISTFSTPKKTCDTTSLACNNRLGVRSTNLNAYLCACAYERVCVSVVVSVCVSVSVCVCACVCVSLVVSFQANHAPQRLKQRLVAAEQHQPVQVVKRRIAILKVFRRSSSLPVVRGISI